MPEAVTTLRDLNALSADAQAARAAGQPLPSPCVLVCRIDAQTGWCAGCYRRLEEIGGWRALSDDAKWDVWQRIEARRRRPPATEQP